MERRAWLSDVTNPVSPVFVQYDNTRDFNEAPENLESGDLGPKGKPLLVVANEVSGTTTVCEINRTLKAGK
jgi:hypothetical protein